MDDKNWMDEARRLAQAGDPAALALFLQHNIEAVKQLLGERAAAAAHASVPGDLMERDTREIAQIVAKWTMHALPADENVLSITVDVSQWGETPLVTVQTAGGEVIAFDTNEASRANEAHLEDCRHVEASWADWQDEPGFIGLFCNALSAALTAQELPEPEFIR